MSDWRQQAPKAKYVIVGPTGWIGRATLGRLHAQLGEAWRDQVSCYGSRARSETGPDGIAYEVQDLRDLKGSATENALVFHLAYLTKDKTTGLSDSEFFAANLEIDQFVLSAVEAGSPRGLFVASSGAARDVTQGLSRNLYGITKLLQEERFEAFGRAAKRPTLVGRIYNVAGPHINKLDLYAVSSFAQQAFRTGSIKIEARLLVFRSFLHVEDLVELVIADLLSGTPTNAAVDLCGPEVVEMQHIAEAVAKELGLPSNVIKRETIDFTRASSHVGSAQHVLGLSIKHGIRLRDFATQIRDTVDAVRGAI